MNNRSCRSRRPLDLSGYRLIYRQNGQNCRQTGNSTFNKAEIAQLGER